MPTLRQAMSVNTPVAVLHLAIRRLGVLAGKRRFGAGSCDERDTEYHGSSEQQTGHDASHYGSTGRIIEGPLIGGRRRSLT